MYYPVFQFEKSKFYIVSPKVYAASNDEALEKALTYSLVSGEIDFIGIIDYSENLNEDKFHTFNGIEIYLLNGDVPETFSDTKLKMENDSISLTIGIDEDEGSPFIVLQVNDLEKVFTPTEARQYSRQLYFKARDADFINTTSDKLVGIEFCGVLLDANETLLLSEDLFKVANLSEIDSFYYNAMGQIYEGMPEEEKDAFISAIRISRKNYMEKLNEEIENSNEKKSESADKKDKFYKAIEESYKEDNSTGK